MPCSTSFLPLSYEDLKDNRSARVLIAHEDLSQVTGFQQILRVHQDKNHLGQFKGIKHKWKQSGFLIR